jgi:electron transport complex protein RnfE
MGTGFALLLMTIGFFRELIGQASILSDLSMLTGNDGFGGLSFADSGLLLLILPPGAFFSLALAVAAKNAIDRKQRQKHNTGATRSLRRSG